LVKPTDEDRKKWKIYEIPIITIAKEEVGNVVTQSVVALGVTIEMTKVLDAKIVEEVMLSTVPEKVKEANKKAYELGIKYAQISLLG
ncbi:MAG: 2-oxoacid:acceptor oxidoreductase family protein, partial [Campylobacteraceae bacterium]|nr:2-oxoacid:acceptor oxidoreductase family protein [Campylobacteraceae bacterium]